MRKFNIICPLGREHLNPVLKKLISIYVPRYYDNRGAIDPIVDISLDLISIESHEASAYMTALHVCRKKL